MTQTINSTKRGKWLTTLAHMIVICLIFFLPELMRHYGQPERNMRWEGLVYLKSAFCVGVFYVNYYWLINKTIFAEKRRFMAFVLVNVLMVIVMLVSVYMWKTHMLFLNLQPTQLPDEISLRVFRIHQGAFYLRDVVMVVLSIGLSVALKFSDNWRDLEKKHEQLLSSQRTEELNNLKHQLNPHFLFNTLNMIYSLIDISPKEAKDAVHRLSKMLRYVLYENPQRVHLSQEIEFLRNYISLMEVRLGDGMVKATFAEASGSDPEVAPLLFITLIENAIKYGNTGRKDDKIDISLTSDEDGVVTCRTVNHFIVGKESLQESKKSGIGLVNLKRRLLLIYGDAARLEIKIDGDIYTSVLTINTRTAK